MTQVENLLEDAEDSKNLAAKLKSAIKRFDKGWIRNFPEKTKFLGPEGETFREIQNLGQDEACRIFNENNKEDRAWKFLPLGSWLLALGKSGSLGTPKYK